MFKFSSLAVTLLLAVSAFAGPQFSCGNNPTSDELRLIEKKFVVNNTASPSRQSNSAAATIDVVVHIVSKDNTSNGGNLPDSLIQRQMDVFNQDSARAALGVTWRLVGIDRTINPNWANGLTDGSAQEQQMKTSLRTGGPNVLNIYTVLTIGGAPPGYLIDGFATFPWDYQSRPWKDGIVLAYHTFPGGPYPQRGQGRTLVHEAGHWIGLYHTFQSGCTAPGDYVDDTPFQQSAASGCPAGRDTCPQPGVDPIQNFMDYTDDSCRTGFTPGQISRARAALGQFRGISV